MKQSRTMIADPLDELCQLRDELRVVWVGLGNEEDAEAYRVEIREHVNGIANRVADIIKTMTEAPK